jgi:hypothetical protein
MTNPKEEAFEKWKTLCPVGYTTRQARAMFGSARADLEAELVRVKEDNRQAGLQLMSANSDISRLTAEIERLKGMPND